MNNFSNFSFKELYDVRLKVTFNIETENGLIEEGETLAFFDTLQIANFRELSKYVGASGGYDNAVRVYWGDTTNIAFSFSSGTFNKNQLSICNNSKMIESIENNVTLPVREKKESSENGVIELKNSPIDKVFIYTADGTKVKGYNVEGKQIKNLSPFTDYIVDYNYFSSSRVDVLLLGDKRFQGFLVLEGYTRIKTEDGKVKTGMIKIPKIQLNTNLSMTLGQYGDPVTLGFSAVGYPIGERHNRHVMELAIIDADLKSDM